MKLCIVHGGQTGVDRGAAYAALQMGVMVDGFCPQDMSDEGGRIPEWALKGLRPCRVDGKMQRTIANVAHAHMVLCVVEDVQHPYRTPGTALTLQAARSIVRPRFAVDSTTPLQMITTWLRDKSPNGVEPIRLMVAGPRASLWKDGERVACSIICALTDRDGPWR